MRLSRVCSLAVLAAVAVASAQEPYPSRPITMVAPFPPGGIADLTARPVAAAMEKVLKNPVGVLNKTGAAGAVGMQFVATSKPDGYTLLLALSSISIIPEADKLFGRPPALAGWGDKRVVALPEVPTFKELGFPDAEFYIWAGVFAPKGTPEPVLAKLRDALRAAVNDSDFKGAMEKIETPIVFKQGAEFARFFEADAGRLAEGVRKVGRIETK